jgi:hypothetical protein
VKDPELLAEKQKQKMDVDPESGENLEVGNADSRSTPEVLARVKKILGN